MNSLVPESVQRQAAAGARDSNLAFALLFLPRERRGDTLVFYRWCRMVDDIADAPGIPDHERAACLDGWIQALAGRQLASLPADFAALIERHRLDCSILTEIVRGVEMDLHQTRYETFDDLRRYAWRVASAVGLISIELFGCRAPQSRACAENLGLALQITNILRDVREDALRGRIYIPLEDLASFNVAENEILVGAHSDRFTRLMRCVADRANGYFDAASKTLPPADRKALLPARIMQRIYSRILRTMERDGFRVFSRRYRVSKPMKVLLALWTTLRG